MRSLPFASATFVALCVLLATGCSKDDGGKPEKGSTLPGSKTAKGPRADGDGNRVGGAKANPGNRGPGARGPGGRGRGPGGRPAGGKAPGKQGANKDENRPKSNKGAGGGKKPATTVNFFGTFAGLVTNDAGDVLAMDLSMSKGPGGGVHGSVNIPALRVRNKIILPKIMGDSVRFRPMDAKGPEQVTLHGSGGGKVMIGTMTMAVSKDAPSYDIALRRVGAEAGITTDEYSGSMTMAAGDMPMKLVTVTTPRGDVTAFAVVPKLNPDPIVLRQVKVVDGALSAIWSMGATVGSFAVKPEADGMVGALKSQGKERKITLKKATSDDGAGADTDEPSDG